jgi:hypothetical protein
MHDPIEHLFRQTEQVQHFHCGSFDRRNHLVMRVSTVKRKGWTKKQWLAFQKENTQCHSTQLQLSCTSRYFTSHIRGASKTGEKWWYPLVPPKSNHFGPEKPWFRVPPKPPSPCVPVDRLGSDESLSHFIAMHLDLVTCCGAQWNEGLENQRLFRISASILWGILRVYKLYQIMKYAHKNSENPQWIMSKYCTVGFRNDCSYIVDLALMIRCDCSCGHGSKAVCQTLALLQIDQKPWGCNLHSDNLWQIRKTYENLISQKPSNEPSRQDPQCSWFISWFLLARVGSSCHNYIDILIIYMNNSIIFYIL